MTSCSLGPAGRSMPGPPCIPATCRLASVTNELPGPKILSQRGIGPAPKAIAHTACAPPTTAMRRMPTSTQAATTLGSAVPCAVGGVHTTTSGQPASTAGTPSISAVEGSGAEPAGTYSPTVRTGRTMRSQRMPGAVSTANGLSPPGAWKVRRVAAACAMAARTASGTCSTARSISASLSSRSSRRTPSKRSVYPTTASAPRSRTASRTSATAAVTCSPTAWAGRSRAAVRSESSRAFQSRTRIRPASPRPAAP